MTSTLTELRKINPHIKIQPVEDPSFCHFGRVHSRVPVELASAYARQHAVPGDGVVYEASIEELEKDGGLMTWLIWQVYGEMPVQLGWCYGRNQKLDCLEYHKGTEVLIAVTDMIILLGNYDDIDWYPHPSYDSARIKAFYVPQGAVVELYPWCLHYAPVQTRPDGFCSLIALPSGTNHPFEHAPAKVGEAALLVARNKWLIAHPEMTDLIKNGALAGIKGENIRLNGIEPG